MLPPSFSFLSFLYLIDHTFDRNTQCHYTDFHCVVISRNWFPLGTYLPIIRLDRQLVFSIKPITNHIMLVSMMSIYINLKYGMFDKLVCLQPNPTSGIYEMAL